MSRGYFVRVPTFLFEDGEYLTPDAKLIYIVLLSFTNNKTGKTFPSYEKIMMRSRMGRNKLAAALNELEHFLWITRKKVFIGGNHYKLDRPHNKNGTPVFWPTKEAAQRYAIEVKKDKLRYGWNPWEKEEPYPPYTEREDLDDGEIPF